MKKTIGIIGGRGKLGGWFKTYFEKKGHKVLVSGRSTPLTPQECAAQSDVVIISVPISNTLDVIKQVGPHVRQDALLMDVTSIKKEQVACMLKHSKGSVIGTHPVFGPLVKGIKNQSVVLCPARPGEWLPWLEGIFKKDGALIRVTTPEKHDKMMSIVQGIIHFSTISLAHALKSLGVDVNESMHFTSPIYKVRMDMVGRMLNQDPELYADIEISNKENPKAIKAYMESLGVLQEIINNGDRQKFISYFNESAEFLGDFKDEATKYSEYIIEQLVKKGSME